MRETRITGHKPLIIQLTALVGILALWEVLPRLFGINPLVLPTLSASAETLFREPTGDGSMVFNFAVTVQEVVLAFLIGGAAGVAVGLTLGLTTRLRKVVLPLVTVAFAVPIVVLIPLFLVTFGLGTASKVAFGALYGFFPVVFNTIVGVQSLDPLHVSLAKSLGLSRVSFLRKIVLRSAARSILNGLQTALAMCIIAVVSIQMFGAHAGLGYLINAAGQRLRTDEVFGLNILVLLMAVLLLSAVKLIGRAFRVRLEVSAE